MNHDPSAPAFRPPRNTDVPASLLAAEALRRLDGCGFGPIIVVNQVGVVMGAAHRADLEAAPADAPAGALMRFGVTTVRPSEQAADLAHRMGHAGVTRVVVTCPDGTLVGLFFAADLTGT